jgi:hypothetical protein
MRRDFFTTLQLFLLFSFLFVNSGASYAQMDYWNSDQNFGYTLVQKDNKFGLLDDQNRLIVPIKYESIANYSDSVAVIKSNHKFGCIDKYGEEVIEPLYDDLQLLSPLYLIAAKGDFFGLIDINQNIIIPFRYHDIEVFNDSLYLVELNGYFGLCDLSGREIMSPEFNDVHFITEHMVLTIRNGVKEYYIFTNDNLTALPYENIGNFKSDTALAVYNDHLFFIDRQGQMLTDELKITSVYTLGIQHKCVQINGSYALLDMDYNWITTTYDKITGTGPFNVWINGKQGVLDNNGKVIIPAAYDKIELGEKKDTFYITEIDGLKGLFTQSGKLLVEPKYDRIDLSDRSVNRIPVLNDGKWGFIDLQGTEVITCLYSQTGEYRPSKRKKEGLVAPVRKNHHWVLIDQYGKELRCFIPKSSHAPCEPDCYHEPCYFVVGIGAW